MKTNLKRLVNYLKIFKLLLTILVIIFFSIFFGHKVPIKLMVFSFSISEFIRNILSFLLPFLIFPYMATSIVSMKSNGIFLIMLVMFIIVTSNFFSIMIPYFIGIHVIPSFIKFDFGINLERKVEPLFNVNFPILMGIEKVMLVSIIFGIILNLKKSSNWLYIVNNFLEKYLKLSKYFFEKIFIPVLPIYILGVALKTAYVTDFRFLFFVFGRMILTIVIIQSTYIIFLFLIGSAGRMNKAILAIKNSLQAGIVGFSTMSSLITMPVTLKAAEKNTNNPIISKIVVTSTVNCHDIGECISLPMIALTILYMISGEFPNFDIYLLFALNVAIAQFSGVSVPGGSIVIIIPFLISYLGFTSEMINLIIVLSILMDPIGTASNVMGNCAFVTVINRVWSNLKIFKEKIT